MSLTKPEINQLYPQPYLKDGAFYFPIRIYYEDTDAGGVVYHARYLHFLERARTEWLRFLGIDATQMRAESGMVFVVAKACLTYHAPLHLDDQAWVVTRIQRLKGVRLEINHWIEDNNRCYATADITLTLLDIQTQRPRRFTESLKKVILHGE